MGGEPPIPPAAQGGQVCQKILYAPVGRCDNFIDKGPACFAKIIRCCVLFGLDVFPRSRWSLYSVAACIFRKPSPRKSTSPKKMQPEGVQGRPESPRERAGTSLSNQTKSCERISSPQLSVHKSFNPNQSGERKQHYSLFIILYSLLF